MGLVYSAGSPPPKVRGLDKISFLSPSLVLKAVPEEGQMRSPLNELSSFTQAFLGLRRGKKHVKTMTFN